MSIVKDVIGRLRNEGNHISRPMEQYLLSEYIEESFPYGWTDEYAAYLEIKGVVDAFARTGTREFLDGRTERLIEVSDRLREMYIDLLFEYTQMAKQIPDDYEDGSVCDYF